jgi:hypothetical protein
MDLWTFKNERAQVTIALAIILAKLTLVIAVGRPLWLQTWTEAAIKDRDELRLHREVCAGRTTLERAQHDMLATWGPRRTSSVLSQSRRTTTSSGDVTRSPRRAWGCASHRLPR